MKQSITIIVLVLFLASGAWCQTGAPSGAFQPSGGGNIAALNGDGPLFNVQNSAYAGGAKGTGRGVADAVSNSTSTITSATAAFTAADTGSKVVVFSSSFNQAAVCATGTATFVNSTTITTSVTCGSSASGLNLFIGPDDSAAIAAACTALSNTKRGGVIYFPPGNYVVFGTAPVCTLSGLQNATTQPGINAGAGWYADTKGTVNVWIFPGYSYTNGTGDIINAVTSGVPILVQNMNIQGLGVTLSLGSQSLFYSSGFFVVKDTNIWNFAMGGGAGNTIFAWTGDGGSVYGRSDFENLTTLNVQAVPISCSGFRFSVFNSDIVSPTDAGINVFTGCGEAHITNSNVSGSPAILNNTTTTVLESAEITVDASHLCANPGSDAVFANATGAGGAQTIYISNSILNLGSTGGVGGGGTCGGTTNVTGLHTAANNTIRVTNTRVETQGTGKTFNNAGTVIDAGANNFVSPTFSGAGSTVLNPTSQGVTPTLTGTGACATITTQVPSSAGAGLSGTFKCTGTTGASTVTITWPLNAPNGYNCRFADQTTTANSLTPTVGTATTCVASASTITANDVIQWSALPL